MAEKKDDKQPKKRTLKTSKKKELTVRERAATSSTEKPKRIRKAASKAGAPLSKAKEVGKKEYHVFFFKNKNINYKIY